MSAPNLYQRIAQNTLAINTKQKAINGLRKTINHDKKRIASHQRKLKRLQDSLLPSSHDAKPEPLDFSGALDKKEIAIIKIIAQRLRYSRQLSEHKTHQAAALLGITPADLKKIESVVDIDCLPAWLIRRAAEIYCVPADYLFGLIEDWDAADGEVFLSRNHLAALQRQQLEEFSKTAAEQIKQNGQLKALRACPKIS